MYLGKKELYLINWSEVFGSPGVLCLADDQPVARDSKGISKLALIQLIL